MVAVAPRNDRVGGRGVAARAAGGRRRGVLQRALGLRSVVSTSAGLAFAAINFLAVTAIRRQAPGWEGPVAILLAGALCLLVAACFGELNGTLPSAAGIRVWTLRGIGDPFSLAFTLLYLPALLLVMAADGFVLGAALHRAVPVVPPLLWVLVLLGAALAANLRGVRAAALVQDLTTYGLLATLAVVSALALGRHPVETAAPLSASGGGGFFTGVALAVFIFTGFEWVTPLAEEVQDNRRMPLGLTLALALLAVGFGLFGAVAARLPRVPGGDVAPQLAVGRLALGALGFWSMLVVTVVTAGTTFNGGLAAASRLVYALGRSRYLPAALGRLNTRFVPARALWLLVAVVAVLIAGVFLTRQYLVLINMGAVLECSMYVVAAVALLGLRRREPALPRSWKAPGGRALPLVTAAIFGLLAVGAAVAPSGIRWPAPWFPWPLLVLIVLALAAFGYARRTLRRRPTAVRAGRAARR